MVYRDCVESSWGEIDDCVGSILFGDYLCTQKPDPVTNASIVFTSSSRLGWSLYRLNCTLPALDRNNTQVRPGSGAPGKMKGGGVCLMAAIFYRLMHFSSHLLFQGVLGAKLKSPPNS